MLTCCCMHAMLALIRSSHKRSSIPCDFRNQTPTQADELALCPAGLLLVSGADVMKAGGFLITNSNPAARCVRPCVLRALLRSAGKAGQARKLLGNAADTNRQLKLQGGIQVFQCCTHYFSVCTPAHVRPTFFICTPSKFAHDGACCASTADPAS